MRGAFLCMTNGAFGVARRQYLNLVPIPFRAMSTP